MTTPFEWKESYATDIKSIDRQHEKLLEILNALTAAMDRGAPKTELLDLFGELLRFTKLHFTYEERLLAEHHYPGLEAHTNEHNLLLSRGRALQSFIQDGKLEFTKNVTVFLSDWLADHLVNCDQKYANFLIQRGVQ